MKFKKNLKKEKKIIDRLPTLMLACIVWIKNKISINHVVVIYWLKDKMWSSKGKKKRLQELLAIPSLKDFSIKRAWALFSVDRPLNHRPNPHSLFTSSSDGVFGSILLSLYSQIQTYWHLYITLHNLQCAFTVFRNHSLIIL